ncbi:MAG: sigma 54-interacting transcriptional regulator [Trueperaceae bacterium]|nr:sigma 54-interacting transcriptional regulator [Trueperaceae bacterium]
MDDPARTPLAGTPVGGADGARPATLGELRASRWAALAGRSVKDELRANLVSRLRQGGPVFPGIVGYDDTVVPQIVNALLARHNFILLGLRGQAKTRMLRQLTDLLDPLVPVLAGSELNDDPLAPVSLEGRTIVAEQGDEAEVAWLPREARYVEKLATPDVTVADIVGDIDPIKASRLGTRLGDERSVHYGLLPRANRGVFAVNELPDLSGKVQVALFNVMQEGDVQIRGYPVRLPLDVLLVFSANPEDYTARGKIITPLKDRIGSEVRTHYQGTVEEGMRVTAQEAWTARDADVLVPAWVAEAVEQVAFIAREDARVDKHSGVSQRLPISLLETVISNAERRALAHGDTRPVARISDLYQALSAVTGKLELEYEGELKGGEAVARDIVREAIGRTFTAHAGELEVEEVVAWFENDAVLRLPGEVPADRWLDEMAQVPGLLEASATLSGGTDADERAAAGEFVLEGLHARRRIGRSEERGYVAVEPDAREAGAARRRWN